MSCISPCVPSRPVLSDRSWPGEDGVTGAAVAGAGSLLQLLHLWDCHRRLHHHSPGDFTQKLYNYPNPTFTLSPYSSGYTHFFTACVPEKFMLTKENPEISLHRLDLWHLFAVYSNFFIRFAFIRCLVNCRNILVCVTHTYTLKKRRTCGCWRSRTLCINLQWWIQILYLSKRTKVIPH